MFAEGFFFTDDPFGLREPFLDEITRAVYAPPFEGQQATYGSILLARELDHYKELLPSFEVFRDDHPKVRNLADGSYVLFCAAADFRGLIALDDPIVDELTAFTLRDDAVFRTQNHHPDDGCDPWDEVLVVRRDSSGGVLALCSDGLVSFGSGHWAFRPYQYRYQAELVRAGVPMGLWDDQIVRSILRMCVHLLGPQPGAGGTFVLLTERDEIALGMLAGDDAHTSPCAINFSNSYRLPWNPSVDHRKCQRPIVHLLEHTDGAVVIDHKGKIAGIRCWLVPPASGASTTHSHGGTRHLSAQSFSSGIEGLVFVVSADGPLSVYSNGEKVVSTVGLLET